MKKSSATKSIGYVLDYAPVIATVLLATLASLSSARRNITNEEMLQWVLSVLALLATTQLVDRFRLMRSIDTKVDQLVDRSQLSGRADMFFVDGIPDLEKRVRQAKSIAINGITLSRTSTSFWDAFSQCLAEGTQIRLIVVDPTDNQALGISANRLNKHQDPVKLQREIEYSLANLESLVAKDITGDNFQVRLFPSFPPYSIWSFDADTPKAEIRVQVYSFQGSPEPVFHLLPHRDGQWFSFFQGQFEAMWNVSRAYTPNSAKSASENK